MSKKQKAVKNKEVTKRVVVRKKTTNTETWRSKTAGVKLTKDEMALFETWCGEQGATSVGALARALLFAFICNDETELKKQLPNYAVKKGILNEQAS